MRRGPVATVIALLVAACGTPEDSVTPRAGPGPPTPSPGALPMGGPFGPPEGIVALTQSGDIVEIDHRARTVERTIASFPPRDDPEGGPFQAQDVSALPDGRILVDTCCEPAAGNITLVDERARVEHGILAGWDPHVSGPYLVRAEYIFGVEVLDVSLERRVRRFEQPADEVGSGPQDPSLSPDGEEIVFTMMGRLGIVPVSATSLTEATYLAPPDGEQWSSPVSTDRGVVAVLSPGPWRGIGPNEARPSRLVLVDPATGEDVEIASSTGSMPDVSVDQSGRDLIWVEDGSLRWEIDGERVGLEGDFLAAAWIPARPG